MPSAAAEGPAGGSPAEVHEVPAPPEERGQEEPEPRGGERPAGGGGAGGQSHM